MTYERQVEPALNRSVTFAVSNVEHARVPLRELPYVEAVTLALADRVTPEAVSRSTKRLVHPLPKRHQGTFYGHSVVNAAALAYAEHRPLVLSPDMIWLMIVQGLALHVKEHAEDLRDRLVSHAGKAKLIVTTQHFVRGFAGNDWEAVIEEFTRKIGAHVGADVQALVNRSFSTTGTVERTAVTIAFMDGFRKYFDYKIMPICGIPEITLEGTTDDWQSVRDGAAGLASYDLEWWIDRLLPVLDQFVRASRGDVDPLFWRSLFKVPRGDYPHICGDSDSLMDGYLGELFPYIESPTAWPEWPELHDWYRNVLPKYGVPLDQAEAQYDVFVRHRARARPRRNVPPAPPDRKDGDASAPASGLRSIDPHYLPPSLSTAPFVWDTGSGTIPMEFVSGFVGIAQNPDTLSLRPEIGWAVREQRASPLAAA